MLKKFHMGLREKEITEISELEDIIMSKRYATIGLSIGDMPYLVTMSHAYDKKKLTLYFHTANEGLKLNILKKNPEACATIIDDCGYQEGKCDHSYRSVVIYGKLLIVEDFEEKRHALQLLLDQQENFPDRTKEKMLASRERYDITTVLKMVIIEMTGKDGRPERSPESQVEE